MIKYFGIVLLLCQITNAQPINVPIDKNTRNISRTKILQYANSFIGFSYGYDQKNKQKIDCSGFVQEVFSHFGILLPRSVFEQSHVGRRIDFKNIQKGDLLFFSTHNFVPSHVAIYLGNGRIIHASYTAKCVHCDTIDKAFYRKSFLFAKRLFTENMYSIAAYSHSNTITNKDAVADTLKHLSTRKSIVTMTQVRPALIEIGSTCNQIETATSENSMTISNDSLILTQPIRRDSIPLPVPLKKFRNYQIFDSREIIISKEGEINLRKWAQQFKQGGHRLVTINVYTDNIPPKLMQARFATNLILSGARAKMISDYLILQGINSNDIQANGMGDTSPISSNDTADGQSKNRRVEFIF